MKLSQTHRLSAEPAHASTARDISNRSVRYAKVDFGDGASPALPGARLMMLSICSAGPTPLCHQPASITIDNPGFNPHCASTAHITFHHLTRTHLVSPNSIVQTTKLTTVRRDSCITSTCPTELVTQPLDAPSGRGVCRTTHHSPPAPNLQGVHKHPAGPPASSGGGRISQPLPGHKRQQRTASSPQLPNTLPTPSPSALHLLPRLATSSIQAAAPTSAPIRRLSQPPSTKSACRPRHSHLPHSPLTAAPDLTPAVPTQHGWTQASSQAAAQWPKAKPGCSLVSPASTTGIKSDLQPHLQIPRARVSPNRARVRSRASLSPPRAALGSVYSDTHAACQPPSARPGLGTPAVLSLRLPAWRRRTRMSAA